MGRLGGKGFVVAGGRLVRGRCVGWEEDAQVVPEDSEREDGDGEAIAAEAGVAAEQLRDGLIVVFCGVSTEPRDCGSLAWSRG
jgi:hypothetical protein